jgi:hypothetical protein
MASQESSIEELAAAWLSAEREATFVGNGGRTERDARDISTAYDEAIRTASAEDLLVAWEAARAIQAAQEMGSADWIEARRVSELLRTEYEAMRRAG